MLLAISNSLACGCFVDGTGGEINFSLLFVRFSTVAYRVKLALFPILR